MTLSLRSPFFTMQPKLPLLLRTFILLSLITRRILYFATSLHTPKQIDNLHKALQNYPHKNFILEGFSEGFHLGFEGEDIATFGKNGKTINDNVTIAEGKIDQELKLNRIAGPFSHPPFAHFKISPLALRPKKDSSKFRLLHNLSYPMIIHQSISTFLTNILKLIMTLSLTQ